MKALFLTLPLVALAACAQPLAQYRPVIDPSAPNAARFEGDLQACRAIATNAQNTYKARQDQEAIGGMVTGALIGAAIGAAVGNHEDARRGLAYGAAIGGLSAETTSEQIHSGPRRIIDRCLSDRGHRLLNDFGQG